MIRRPPTPTPRPHDGGYRESPSCVKPSDCAPTERRLGRGARRVAASRRINGSVDHLPVMADCERGLGRPERALALAASPEARGLDRAGTVEMRIVASGARRDLGQPEAAVVSLQGADLDRNRRDPWSARLFYAYADALLAARRRGEAREWFVAAALADAEGDTDAQERIDELDAGENPDAFPQGSLMPASSTP